MHDDETEVHRGQGPPPLNRGASGAPSQLGGYRLLNRLGSGGSAVVYRACAPDGREVAIKLPSSAHPPSELLKRFHRERTVLTRLSHPAIVGVHGTGLTPQGLPYIVMDWIRGGDLADVFPRRSDGRLSAAETAYVVCRGAQALAAAHAAGLIHRDVKPANLLVTVRGEVLLTDFGIALSEDDSFRLTEPGYVVGTALYMAPEMLVGDDDWSQAADLYSLGAVAYQCLAGRPPHRVEAETSPADRLRALIDLKRFADPEPLAEAGAVAPPALVALIGWLLNRDPEDRPGAQEVLTFLDEQVPERAELDVASPAD